MSMTVKTLDIRGAHRGGEQATRALLEYDDLPPMRVLLVDREEGRAVTLARRWADAGHLTSTCFADAREVPVHPDVDVLGLCTDDATVQFRLLQDSSARLIVMGLLAASNEALEFGGRVLGFGTVIPASDRTTRANASLLFERLMHLTGGNRVTSRAVSTPLLNAPQLDVVRQTLYHDLARDARTFLVEDAVPGRLIIASAWPIPAAYTLHIRPREGRLRAQMRAEAEAMGAGQAIAYVEEGKLDWLYTVIPSARRRTFMVELPTSLAVQRGYIMPRSGPAAEQNVYATD